MLISILIDGGITGMPRSTKYQILKGFSALLKDNELDKITVTMLVKECNISRQTFYYHFSDIPSLINWGIKQSTAYCMESVKATNDIIVATQIYFDFIEENRFFLAKCLSSSYFGYTAGLLKRSVAEYISYFINQSPALLNSEKEVSDFITDFLSDAVTGQIITSVYGEEKIDLKEIPEKIEKMIFQNFIPKPQ